MAGLSVLLVVVASIVYLSRFEPIDLVIISVMGGSILAAMYLGWRLGKVIGDRRAG